MVNGGAGMWLKCLLVACVTCLPACGGGNPTAPSPTVPPTPPAPTVTLSGAVTALNGAQTLGGLQVSLGPATATTDAQGAFTAVLAPTPSLALQLAGTGIVPRSLWVSAATTRSLDVTAIALSAPFDLAFYRELVRNASESESLQPLRRWTRNPSIYLQDVGNVDAKTLDLVDSLARQAVSDWSAGTLSVVVVERGPASRQGQPGWLTVLFGTDTQYCGLSDVGRDGGTVTFYPRTPNCGCNGYSLRPKTIRHEVGHAMGYWHTSSPTDVMYRTTSTCDLALSDRERYHAAIAYSRPVGNADPDADPSGAVNLAPMRVVQ
jgi:hypothetical protein